MPFKTTALTSVLLLTCTLGTVPTSDIAYADTQQAYAVALAPHSVDQDAQSMTVSAIVTSPSVERDGYTATSQAELDARAAAKKAAADKIAAEKKAAEDKAKAAKEAADAAATSASAKTVDTSSLPVFTPNPGSAQAYAKTAVAAKGWDDSEFSCLVLLWNKESGWRANAANPSGAYGIPQALPGSKMASAGADWATNAETQINWGLGYIQGSYGTPCKAWSHSESVNWY